MVLTFLGEPRTVTEAGGGTLLQLADVEAQYDVSD